LLKVKDSLNKYLVILKLKIKLIRSCIYRAFSLFKEQLKVGFGYLRKVKRKENSLFLKTEKVPLKAYEADFKK